MNQSDPAEGKEALKFGKWLGCLCLIRKIIPDYCTTILKTTFEEISLWPWKCWIRLRLQLMLVSFSLEERLSNGGQINHWLRILYVGVVSICERLVSRFFHFKLSSTSTSLMPYEAPVMTLPTRFWIFCTLSFSCFPQISDKGEQWSKYGCTSELYKGTSVQSGTKGLKFFLELLYRGTPFSHMYSTWVSKVSFSSINTPKYLLEVTYETILLSMDIASGKSLDLLFKLKRFSLDCRKTKTKVNTPANQRA